MCYENGWPLEAMARQALIERRREAKGPRSRKGQLSTKSRGATGAPHPTGSAKLSSGQPATQNGHGLQDKSASPTDLSVSVSHARAAINSAGSTSSAHAPVVHAASIHAPHTAVVIQVSRVFMSIDHTNKHLKAQSCEEKIH